MNKEEYKFDHFKNIDEVMYYFNYWYKEEDVYSINRYLSLKDFNYISNKYQELQKENQSLKKQLEEKQNPLKGIFAQVNDDTLLRNCGNMNAEINELKNQQKEFIEYLKNEIKIYSNTYMGEMLKEIEEILSKYKEIIGGKE